jgi:hypothetical protein
MSGLQDNTESYQKFIRGRVEHAMYSPIKTAYKHAEVYKVPVVRYDVYVQDEEMGKKIQEAIYLSRKNRPFTPQLKPYCDRKSFQYKVRDISQRTSKIIDDVAVISKNFIKVIKD